MKKKGIRSKYKIMRASLSHIDRMQLINGITQKFNELSLSNIQVVHHYLPVLEQYEISMDGIIKTLKQKFDNIIQVVPVMKNNDMVSVIYKVDMPLKNKWGIQEPVDERQIPETQIDCVLTPLLAFDILGNRVGYGKGCYDRFFTKCRPDVIKIGFSFFPPIERIDDTDKFDIPLNYCITPERIYEFG
jgi:5-formyltetrahydrofolate cyclo-ligase